MMNETALTFDRNTSTAYYTRTLSSYDNGRWEGTVTALME